MGGRDGPGLPFGLFHLGTDEVDVGVGLTARGQTVDLSVEVQSHESEPFELEHLDFLVLHPINFEALAVQLPVVGGVVFVVSGGDDHRPGDSHLGNQVDEVHIVFALICVEVVTNIPL